jgi:uncharacterized protein (TIGR03067 family)
MNRFLIVALISILIAGATTKNTFMNSDKLNGTWIPVRQEMNGKDFPRAAFENYKLTISEDTLYTYGNDSGSLQYDNGKMDIHGHHGPNQGKHITAIYKLENEQLIICYNLAGDSYPSDFETKSTPMLFLSVYKKGE